jgi:hypothetical protein
MSDNRKSKHITARGCAALARSALALAVLLSAVAHSIGANLIQNGDFQSGNTNFVTDYVHSQDDVWEEGTYSITNNPVLVHPAPPFADMGDHTTGSGLMMIVNGWADTPGKTVWKQTVPVATDAAYLFSAWAANLLGESPSTFSFYVNGEQQQPVVQLPIETGIWQNYTSIWTNSTATNAVLEIRLLSTEYVGNDIALDDLAFHRISNTNVVLKIAQAIELYWESEVGQLYQIQWTSNLQSNQWFNVGVPLAGDGSTMSWFESTRGVERRFYRMLPVE